MAPGRSSQSLVIRRATRDDLPRVTALLERYFVEWEVVQRDSPQQIAMYIEQPAPFGFVVAEQSGVLTGCVCLRPLPSIDLAAECKRLYVAPEQRGEGVASLLMDSIESCASGSIRQIYLDTGPNFTAAQSFYRRRGYTRCERYNDNPQATCFFRKSLPG